MSESLLSYYNDAANASELTTLSSIGEYCKDPDATKPNYNLNMLVSYLMFQKMEPKMLIQDDDFRSLATKQLQTVITEGVAGSCKTIVNLNFVRVLHCHVTGVLSASNPSLSSQEHKNAYIIKLAKLVTAFVLG